MDKLSIELLNRIGKALNLKFEGWQVDYILDVPRVLDMRITGRQTGKTLAYIIKLLFSEEKPIRAYDIYEMGKCSDWYSVTNRIDKSPPHYTSWFKGYLTDIYMALKEKGIKPRPVFFNREEERCFYCKNKD